MFNFKFIKNNLRYIFAVIILLATALTAIIYNNIFIVNGSLSVMRLLFTIIICLVTCGAAALNVKALTAKMQTIIAIIILVFTPVYVVNYILLEYNLYFFVSTVLNYCIVLIPFIIIFSITGRSSIAVIAISMAGAFVYGLNTVLMSFRGTPVTPADFFAIDTALRVSESYKFFLTYKMLIAIQSALLWSVLAVKFNIKLKLKFRAFAVVLSLVYIFVFPAASDKVLKIVDSQLIKCDLYDIPTSNKDCGTVLTYWCGARDMFIKAPEGYSKKNAEKILQASPIKGDENFKKPNIVVVMNEAFSDLTDVYNIETNEDVLPYFNSIDTDVVRGDMLVSIFGGGTSITEFEFLTGISSGILGSNTNAFLTAVKKPCSSLAWDLKADGYETVAFHPFWQESWRRSQVYPYLGFDKTIFAEDMGVEKNKGISMRSKPNFENYECMREYLTDRECYKKLEELLNTKEKGKPIFIHNVTIQNHGGYADDYGNQYNNIKVINNNSGKISGDFNTYFTLVNESDKALKDFMAYLKEYDEPTVLVFFGDHQPMITYEAELKEDYLYLDRYSYYVVPFIIWANYDIEEKYVELTSPIYLSTLMKESCNIKTNEKDVFFKQLSEAYPELTLRTGYNKDKEKLDMKKEDTDIYNKYKILQYGILFDGVGLP